MNLFRSFSVYVFNNVLNAAIPFILMPVLTSYLNPAENGVLSLVDVFIRFTLPFIVLGITTAIGTNYFKMEPKDFPSYVSSALSISIISSILFVLLCLIFNSFIQGLVKIPLQWILFTPIICFCQTVVQVVLVLFQSKKKPFQYGQFQIGLTLSNLLLSLFLIAYLHWNWEGRAYGIAISFALFAIIGLFVLYKMNYLTHQISKQYIKDVLWFGLPLVPHLLSGPIIQMLDRIIMTNIIGINWVGIYTVAYQIGISVGLVTVALNQAYAPRLYERLKNIDFKGKKQIVKECYLFMLLFLVIVLLLWLITPLLFHFHFINPKFAESQQFILPISLGSAISGMYFMVVNFIFYEKKTYLLAYVTFGNAILSIILNLNLIPIFGAMGAAITFVITSLSVFITVWILSNKVYPMPWFSFLKQ